MRKRLQQDGVHSSPLLRELRLDFQTMSFWLDTHIETHSDCGLTNPMFEQGR